MMFPFLQAVGPAAATSHWVHDLNPILVRIFGFPIRYYSLAYLLGLMLAWWLLGRLARQKRTALTPTQTADFIMPYCLLGVLVGGRLGYVLFYDFADCLKDPLRIFAIWKGGMASHGGVIGVMVVCLIYGRKHKVPWLHLFDLTALAAPIGLFLGRLANFINGELYGRVTDVSWGVIFKDEAGQFTDPRHPSQLYEAFGEGLLPFLVLLALHRKLLPKTGALSCLFSLIYSIGRIVCEHFREPDAHIGFQIFGTTRGQLLTSILVGMTLWFGWIWLSGRSPRWQAPPEEPPEKKEQPRPA